MFIGLCHYPAGKHEKGSVRKIYDWDTNVYHGQISSSTHGSARTAPRSTTPRAARSTPAEQAKLAEFGKYTADTVASLTEAYERALSLWNNTTFSSEQNGLVSNAATLLNTALDGLKLRETKPDDQPGGGDVYKRQILFHALRKMNIPTVIFINKIDQAGVDLQSVVQSVRDKLSADIILSLIHI